MINELGGEYHAVLPHVVGEVAGPYPLPVRGHLQGSHPRLLQVDHVVNHGTRDGRRRGGHQIVGDLPLIEVAALSYRVDERRSVWSTMTKLSEVTCFPHRLSPN